MSADSIDRPLVDQQMADALSQYAAMKSAEGAEKLKEMLKGSEDTNLGFETLGLGVPPSVMALKSVYDSEPVQTALPYAKKYISDLSEKGFDYANDTLKRTLTEKIQQAALEKYNNFGETVGRKATEMRDLAGKEAADLRARMQREADGVVDEMQGHLTNAQTQVRNVQQGLDARAAAARNQVNRIQQDMDGFKADAENALGSRAASLQEAIQNEAALGANQLNPTANNILRVVPNVGKDAEDGISRALGMQYEAERLVNNFSESANNLAGVAGKTFNRITTQGIATQQEENPGFFTTAFRNAANQVKSYIYGSEPTPTPTSSLPTKAPLMKTKTGPFDEDEFGTDDLIGQEPTDSVGSANSGIANIGENAATNAVAKVGESVGAEVGEEGTAGLLETIGGALDATGVGAIAGAALGLAGLGYSLYSGLKDLFEDHDETPAPDPNRNEAPGIQIGTS